MGKKAGMPYLKTASQQPALLGLAGPAPSIGIRGVEVVQCIQDIDNTVPLIAGKTTLVRIYPDPATVSQEGNVTAELAWSRGGAEALLAGHVVAGALDRAGLPDIIGTVAGDDTILVICPAPDGGQRIAVRLARLAGLEAQ